MPLNLREHQPTTLEEAANLIFENLDENEKDYIARFGARSMHHGVGTAIRNEWGLWAGGPLQDHFKTVYGLGHADDMSGLILQMIDSLCCPEVPFDPVAKAEEYKAYWRERGIDPLSQ